MTTVYISIGNSDDKLSQRLWSGLVARVDMVLMHNSTARHGQWFSHSGDQWQSACWCVEIALDKVDACKQALAHVARTYGQDSIAWAPAITTFIGPVTEPTPEQSTGWAGSEHR